MKQFLKYTLATIVGVFITFIFLGAVLFFTFLGVVSSAGKNKVSVKQNSVLELNINYDVPERSPNDFMAIFGNSDNTILGLDELLPMISNAKTDPKIKGIFLKTNLNNTGYATALEIRNALADFKTSGKFLYTSAPYYDEKNYFIASVADSIFIERSGGILMNGLSANLMFYKGALDKLGVEMQVIKVGAYKGAVESFSRNDLSPENREQISVYINHLYRSVLSSISESRKIDTSKLHNAFNHFDIKTPTQAIAFGLIDKVAYNDEIEKSIKNKLKLTSKDELNIVKAGTYVKSG